MNSCSEDIKTIIEYYINESSGFDLFFVSVGKEPETPSDVISLFDTVGMPPQLTYDRSEKYEYPSVQIRVRASDYREGWQQITKIKDALHGRAQETWNGTFYSLIFIESGPFLLDFDKRQRPRFVLNIGVQRR